MGGQAAGDFDSDPGVPTAPGNLRDGVIESRDAARAKLLLRRDLARMVLPECQADLFYPPATIQRRVRSNGTGPLVVQTVKLRPPALWNLMRESAGLFTSGQIDRIANREGLPANSTDDPRYDAIALANDSRLFNELCRNLAVTLPSGDFPRANTDDQGNIILGIGGRMVTGWTREHESAECLYLILATTRSFRGKLAIDQIDDRNIADTDGDGYLEIVDGWRRPVRFMRSPIGLDAVLRRTVSAGIARSQENAEPFDFLGSDFRLDDARFGGVSAADRLAATPAYASPLVVSAGSDGVFGIVTPESLPADWSSSAVRLGRAPSPRAAGLAYRYPDPFYPVRTLVGTSDAIPSATLSPNGFAETAAAMRGDGMGGLRFGGTSGLTESEARDATNDNLYSYLEDLE